MRALLAIILLVVGVAVGAVLATGLTSPLSGLLGRDEPDPTTLVEASLEAVKAQNRLTPFAARFTVAVTSEQRRLGLAARKTMIVPGTVRYELDWNKLTLDDLRWEEETRTLYVDAPAIEVAEPQVDLSAVQEYADGELLMSLSDAEARLDRANRAKVSGQLVKEAKNPTLVRMARGAARAAVERTFLLPLTAAGVEADVRVRFPDEAGAGS